MKKKNQNLYNNITVVGFLSLNAHRQNEIILHGQIQHKDAFSGHNLTLHQTL